MILRAPARLAAATTSSTWSRRRWAGPTSPCGLAPGSGATITLAMRRYGSKPTVAFPWDH